MDPCFQKYHQLRTDTDSEKFEDYHLSNKHDTQKYPQRAVLLKQMFTKTITLHLVHAEKILKKKCKGIEV